MMVLQRSSHWINKIMTVHPDGNVNVCSLFHHNHETDVEMFQCEQRPTMKTKQNVYYLFFCCSAFELHICNDTHFSENLCCRFFCDICIKLHTVCLQEDQSFVELKKSSLSLSLSLSSAPPCLLYLNVGQASQSHLQVHSLSLLSESHLNLNITSSQCAASSSSVTAELKGRRRKPQNFRSF